MKARYSEDKGDLGRVDIFAPDFTPNNKTLYFPDDLSMPYSYIQNPNWNWMLSNDRADDNGQLQLIFDQSVLAENSTSILVHGTYTHLDSIEGQDEVLTQSGIFRCATVGEDTTLSQDDEVALPTPPPTKGAGSMGLLLGLLGFSRVLFKRS